MKKILLAILFLIIGAISIYLFGAQDTERGIKIEYTLFSHQDFFENWKYRRLISQSLDGNINSLVELKNTWCGGAARCYDQGYVIAQIAYRLGEDKFLEMTRNLPKEDKRDFASYFHAGLEYGYQKPFGFETEFPKLAAEYKK